MNTEDNSGEDENKKMFEKINKRLAALEQLNGMLLKKNNTLEGKIKELKASIGNNTNTSSDNKDNNNEWKDKLIEEINSIKEDNKKFNTLIEDINTKINSNQSNDDLKEKIEEINKRMSEDKTCIDKMKSELESKIEREVENVKGEIDGSKLLQDESIKALENKVKELEGVLSSKESENAWKNKVEGQLKEFLSFKEENNMNDIKTKMSEIEGGFNKELNTMKENIEEINKKYQECHNGINIKYEEISKEMISLIEEKNKSMSEFVSLEIDKMKKELNSAQENQYQSIEKTITEHKLLIDEISKDNSQFSENIKKLNSWKDIVDKQIKAEESKNDKMNTELTSKVGHIEKEIESISILSKQVEAIYSSIKDLHQLSIRIDTINSNIASNKEIVNNQIKTIEDKITENINTIQSTIESTNEKLNDMSKWKDEIDKFSALKEEIQKHEQLLVELEAKKLEIDKLKEDKEKHSNLLSELENKISSIESSNDSEQMKGRVDELQRLFDTLSVSIENIDKKIISIESINAKHTSDISKNSEAIDKVINGTLSTLKNDILSITDSKIKTIETKNSNIEEKVISIENTVKDIKTMKEELNRINDAIIAINKLKSSMDNTILSIKEEISTKNSELTSLINDKENKHNTSLKELNEKIEALAVIKTNIDNIAKKIKELNDNSELNIKELNELSNKVNANETNHIESIKEIKDELIGTRTSIQSLAKEMSSIRSSTDTNINKLSESIENNKKEQDSNIINIKNEINGLISKVDSKDTTHNENIKVITNELRGANASIQSLESKLTSINNSLNKLKDLSQWKDSIDSQINSLNDISKDVASIKEKMNDTQSQQNYINDIDKINKELTIIKDNNANQIVDINKAIDTLKVKIEELSGLKGILEEKITLAIKEVHEKYDKLPTSINDIEKTISSHSTSMSNIFTSLNQIEVLSDIVKTNDSKTSLVINEINTKLSELQNTINTSISSLESKTKDLTTSLTSHITKENQRTSNLELSIQSLHSNPSEGITNEDFNSLKSSIQSQIDNLSQLLKAKSSSDISKELLDINNQLTYMRSNNIKSLSDINTSIDQLFQKTKHITEEAEKYNSELQTMKSDLDANIKAIWDSISLACESNFFNNSANSLHTPKDN